MTYLGAQEQRFGRHLRGRGPAFFVLFWLYLWLEVDPRLIYHGGGMINNFPTFYRGWGFFREFVSTPGGLVAYVSAFLSQFWRYAWVGALIAALQAGFIGLCLDVVVRALDLPRWRWIRFVPAILLLVLYNQYTYRFVTLMALLTALAGICLYLYIAAKKIPARAAVVLVLSAVLYYVAGGAYLLLAAFGMLYELLLRRSWRMAGLHFGAAVTIPWVLGVVIFNIPVHDAFTELTPLSWKVSYYGNRPDLLVIVYVLYGLPLGIVPAGGLWAWLVRPLWASRSVRSSRKGRLGSARKSRRSAWATLARRLSGRRLRWAAESLALGALAGTVICLSHQKNLKILYQTDYYAYHHQWPQVLAAARGGTTNNFLVTHAIDLALYHTDRLGDDMLSYPQHPHALLLTGDKHEWADWYPFDTCLQLGLIHAAEHSLTKALEKFGERPMLLQRLALVNMVKGDAGTARVYLTALSRTLFDASWARTYLDRMASDPNLETDLEIKRLRQRMLRKDCDLLAADYRELLPELLRQNRMAFEYLMACYMMAGQRDLLVQNLSRLDGLGYKETPRLYEEVVIVHSIMNRRAPDRPVSPASLARWQSFRQILVCHGGNAQAALGDLAKQYGDTYFFYNLYGFTGSER